MCDFALQSLSKNGESEGRGNMKFYGYLQLNEEETQKGDLKDRLEDWFFDNKVVYTKIIEEHVGGAVTAKNRINLQDLLKRLKPW